MRVRTWIWANYFTGYNIAILQLVGLKIPGATRYATSRQASGTYAVNLPRKTGEATASVGPRCGKGYNRSWANGSRNIRRNRYCGGGIRININGNTVA